MTSENVVLTEAEFDAFQRFCRGKGFDLCYYGPEIDGREVSAYQSGSPKVIKVKRRRFSSVGIPYDVAEWQQKEWGSALPLLKDEFIKGGGIKMADVPQPQANGAGDASRQLADQLKTVFVAALLTLWTATLTLGGNTPVSRGAWWPWVIASAFVFLWMVWRRKKIRWPKLRWVFPFAAAALLWAMYFIGGLPYPTGLFKGIAALLFAWTLLLLAALVVVMTRGLKEGRLDRVIGRVVMWGGVASWPLSLLVLITGVILGWARLENAGVRGWWMTPLLILGTVIFIVVACVLPRREKDS